MNMLATAQEEAKQKQETAEALAQAYAAQQAQADTLREQERQARQEQGSCEEKAQELLAAINGKQAELEAAKT